MIEKMRAEFEAIVAIGDCIAEGAKMVAAHFSRFNISLFDPVFQRQSQSVFDVLSPNLASNLLAILPYFRLRVSEGNDLPEKGVIEIQSV